MKSFGKADYGIKWALSQLPTGTTVAITGFPHAKGEDDYAIAAGKSLLEVRANSPLGGIGGILKVAEMVRHGKPTSHVQRLRFRTRNYKTESDKVLQYTDAVWERLCQKLVAHHFNGLVFYKSKHPFEDILDYTDYPDAVTGPGDKNAAYRARFNRLLEIAHAYGLTTFIQHYVGHFTQELADKHQIKTMGRLSNIEHPEVERYIRFCYRALFEQCPDLDGLYFNFESYNNAADHVTKTAIREYNKLARKPVFVFRLWNFTDIEAIRSMIHAYKGRVILGHKISDTNDTYYLPVADSRVREWKKALGKNVEWMFLVGPCHNCGTNICMQMWSDYAFVQTLLADAKQKGADSISFNSYLMLFASDVDDGTVFDKKETDLSVYNYPHVLAASDYVAGFKRSRHELADIMAKRAGAPAKAGRALLEAVEASSQLVLLSFQQFCIGSNWDGYLTPHRCSLIQEPFFYTPASERNHQHKSLMWHNLENAWIAKKLPAVVAPPHTYQYILDYVDPAKEKTLLNPKEIVRLMGKYLQASQKAADQYRRLAGPEAADRMETYLRQNSAAGTYARSEIQAGIQLYSIYFAKSRGAIQGALRKAQTQLEALLPLVADPKDPACKSMRRVFMMKLDPTPMLDRLQEALALMEGQAFPVRAFHLYLDSHRHYNDIRRYVRPTRLHDAKHLAFIVKQLKSSLRSCQESLASLKKTNDPKWTAAVCQWRDFVASELERVSAPATRCENESSSEVLRLQHDDCFRAGEYVVEDFISFFRTFDYQRSCGLSARVWHTADALAVSIREDHIDYAAREAQWEKYKDDGSSISFVTRIYLDVARKGVCSDWFSVRPKGTIVSHNLNPIAAVKTHFEHTGTSWQTTVWLPYSLLGHRPKKGEVWGFNVAANPSVDRNCNYTWATQNNMRNAPRFGKITFY